MPQAIGTTTGRSVKPVRLSLIKNSEHWHLAAMSLGDALALNQSRSHCVGTQSVSAMHWPSSTLRLSQNQAGFQPREHQHGLVPGRPFSSAHRRGNELEPCMSIEVTKGGAMFPHSTWLCNVRIIQAWYPSSILGQDYSKGAQEYSKGRESSRCDLYVFYAQRRMVCFHV